jgi:hypothetical protein
MPMSVDFPALFAEHAENLALHRLALTRQRGGARRSGDLLRE